MKASPAFYTPLFEARQRDAPYTTRYTLSGCPERASDMSDRTLVASWTPYEWRRAHERGSGGDSEVGQGADWREAIRAKVKDETSL